MSAEQRNGTGGGQAGETVCWPFSDSLHMILFIVFWLTAIPVGYFTAQFDEEYQLVLGCIWGFLAGFLAVGITVGLYVWFIYKLPIDWQRPYYRHWKSCLIRRATKGVIHPFIDHHMLIFIQVKNGLDYFFEQGGIDTANRALNAWFFRLMDSTEFALLQAAELRAAMPDIMVTVISMPPSDAYKNN